MVSYRKMTTTSKNFTFGSSLAALQFAEQSNTRLVIGDLQFPSLFEPEEIKQAWGLLYSKLMLDGKIFGGDSVKKTRVTEDQISIVCQGNVVRHVDYETLFVFDDKKISGLPAAYKENKIYKVVDHMKAVHFRAYNHCTFETKDKFVYKLYVFKKYVADPVRLYALSELEEGQLYDFNFSDTMAKFKSEHILRENGFEGTFLGKKRAEITLKVLERSIAKKMDFYEDTEKIKFFHGS